MCIMTDTGSLDLKVPYKCHFVLKGIINSILFFVGYKKVIDKFKL